MKRAGGVEEEDGDAGLSRGLQNIFSDDEDEFGEAEENRADRQTFANEFDDFIEEDEFSDDERRRQEDKEIRASSRIQGRPNTVLGGRLTGIDEEQLGEIYEVFGDGEEYDWALEGEGEAGLDLGDEEAEKAVPELKDVFEPGELKARLLTEEDNMIRAKDEPERYQILRSALKMGYDLTENEFNEKVNWIFEKLLSEKKELLQLKPYLKAPLQRSIRKVLEFIAKESLEVPFIWHHRKDYLLHTFREAVNIKAEDGGSTEEKPALGKLISETLLTLDDLWKIVQLDIDFHGILEKKKSVEKIYTMLVIYDSIYSDTFGKCKSLVDYQDLMDYLQFRYSSQLKDMSIISDEGAPHVKRHSRFGRFERIRNGKIYKLVREFGISADEFAENLEANKRLNFAEDPPVSPLELAANYTKDTEEDGLAPYNNPQHALDEAEQMLAEEIFYHPKVRGTVRQAFWSNARIDIVLTDKGLKKIDESSPYYDFKYAINRTFEELKLRPELYLRILLAESEGLVDVRVSYPSYKSTLFEEMFGLLRSDNYSDQATEWNNSRRAVLKNASRKSIPLICRNIKEDLKQDCLRSLYYEVRSQFGVKLSQAPYKPQGYAAGTTARVLALSAGMGDFGKDAILAVMMDEDGQVIETAKFNDPRDAEFRTAFVEFVKRRNPDVIGLAGFTVSSNRLHGILQDVISDFNLYSDEESKTPLRVIWVQDEVARLYQHSKLAATEFSDQPTLGKYCIALARYVQSPLLEYAALGTDISAVHIHPHQYLLPNEMFQEAIDSVYVDFVNLVGVDINEAIRNSYLANVLSYVAGLGPRKASGMLQAIQSKGETLANRNDLVINQITSKTIFMNCASFLSIPYDKQSIRSEETEMLDATRIHPEDYELARKMAADALELDEEDIAAYENSGGVIAQLMSEDPDRLNELILEEYADELEKKFNQKKKETLEMIKAELQKHYGEMRLPLAVLSEMQVFTMLTGETRDTLHAGVIVPANIRKVSDRFAMARLSCGVEGNISGSEMADPGTLSRGELPYQFGSTVQVVVKTVNYAAFTCELSTRQSEINRASEKLKRTNQDPKKWNYAAQEADQAKIATKHEEETRTRRIIKHPLFRLLNSGQAEEYLAPLQRGDLVIRPSSRGNDHIAITWKVGDMLYQHIDVLEIGKTNEYSLGRTLQVGKDKYSDLDELIIMHIQAMARKVDEMVASDKFQKGSRADVEKWLTSYTEANGRSTYAFCFDHKRPGSFLLCFKTSPKTKVETWHARVIPNGFELMGNQYPDVVSLCNGFKKIFSSQMSQSRQQQHGQLGQQSSYRSKPPAPADNYLGGSYGQSSGYGYNQSYNQGYSGYGYER